MRKKIVITTLCLLQSLIGLCQQAKVLTTTGSRSQESVWSTVSVSSTASTNLITLQPAEKYQTVEGFGFAITYAACYNLLKMSNADRKALLTKTFGNGEGNLGASYVRISIGCNDFSSTEYSLCDQMGPNNDLLQHFALHSDEINYVIPVLKEIIEINPDLKIMGSPWTPPRWMKTNNQWTDGTLRPEYRQTYADYFVKFIQAFKAHGINIYSVTQQNEPWNAGNSASMIMSPADAAEFAKKLAPTFKHNGITTKIYVYDHNYDAADYPLQCYNLIGDIEGGELIVGAAFHNYGGEPSAMTGVHNERPDKELMFTEASIGTWGGSDGRNLSYSLCNEMWRVGFGPMLNWARGSIVWNFMLDMNMSPNRPGGCQTCFGAVDIDQNGYKNYTFNSFYFNITHFSAVVKPGAQRIGTSGWKGNGVEYAAFRNTDGSMAVVFMNKNEGRYTTVTDGEKYVRVFLPANSVVSVLFDSDVVVLTPSINGEELVNKQYQGQLVQNNTYKFENIPALSNPSWYHDPDFFMKIDEGEYKFLAKTGWYHLTVDEEKMYFRIYATDASGNTLTYNKATGEGAVWVIGNSGVGKPSYATNGCNWQAYDMEHNICMAPIDDKTYQITLTIGQQLNPSSVDFKLFGQPWWDDYNEFSNKNGAVNISTDSNVFGIGTGSNGHDAGNVYLKGSVNGGDTYVFTLSTANINNAVLHVEKAEGQSTGIHTVLQPTPDNHTYDLCGRRILDALQGNIQPGIYIVGGRKVIFY